MTIQSKWYNFYTVMEFEFDKWESDSNKRQNEIDFAEAQILWDDADRIEIPAQTEDEPRTLIIGKISGKHWSAVTSYREERVRIISVRRSRREEIDIYES